MTAGSGLVHSEMPEQEAGVMEGFQLWLNLPAKDKLCQPLYRDIQSASIPELTTPTPNQDGSHGGVLVRVISGSSHGVEGAMHRPAATYPTDTLYLDLHFPLADADFQQDIPAGYNAFVYVFRGEVHILDAQNHSTSVPSQRMAILDNTGDAVRIRAQGARALLIAGRPLNEPIAQYGPFVMNTREELIAAVEDFQHGRMNSGAQKQAN